MPFVKLVIEYHVLRTKNEILSLQEEYKSINVQIDFRFRLGTNFILTTAPRGLEAVE